MIVDLHKDSSIIPIVHSTQCISSRGCFEISLATKQNDNQWLIFGHPFFSNTVWNDLRVTTSSGECADSDGCPLAESEGLNIVQNHGWQYNPLTENYDNIQNSTLIESWDGLWMRTLNMAHDLNPKLLVPID